ncbi:MAG: J domain-containing protein [Acidobacteria bacterium]|nr:J domain-containing protein [Acidobacteriota bacterium]
MVNYYDILKVSPQASSAEIKSAYRRLARKLHPDSHQGSEETALKFAEIAEAYEVLSKPKDRARYDKRLLEITLGSNGFADSFIESSNPHARRWRQMVVEKRYSDIIDKMIAEERNDAIALQKFLFPLGALVVSVIFFSMIRPDIFFSSYFTDITGVLARLILVTLFVIGVIHVIGRMREAFDRFAFDDNDIHDSVLDGTEIPTRHWSRYSMSALIILGIVGAFTIGFGVGYGLDLKPSITAPYLFSEFPQIDILLFPPIFVLLVDSIHGLILNLEK